MSPALRRVLSWAGFAVLVAGVMVVASGGFSDPGIRGGRTEEPEGLPAPARTVVAGRGPAPIVEEAVGTVHPRTRVVLTAEIGGVVARVERQVGDGVEAGELLVVLDAQEPAVRAAEARAGVAAAEAARERAVRAVAEAEAHAELARTTRARTERLFAQGAATQAEVDAAVGAHAAAAAAADAARAAVDAASAGIDRARESVRAAEVVLRRTELRAPLTGVVEARHVEPGDLAWPGRPLLALIEPRALRVEAQVREGLLSRVPVGTRSEVELSAGSRVVSGEVAEIVPRGDPRTRTYEVRVDLPYVPGLLPGAFARLRIPVGEREVVRVPAQAIRRVGQLETVIVRDGERWVRRLVTTGSPLGAEDVEVLSGLAGGETVGLPPEAPR